MDFGVTGIHGCQRLPASAVHTALHAISSSNSNPGQLPAPTDTITSDLASRRPTTKVPSSPTPPTPRPLYAPSGPQVQSSLTAAHPALAAACEPPVKAHLTLAVMALCEGPTGLGCVRQGRRGGAGEGADNEGSNGKEGAGTAQQEPELTAQEAGRGEDTPRAGEGQEPKQEARCGGGGQRQGQGQGQAGSLPWRLVEALAAVGRLPGALAAAGADRSLTLRIKGLNSFGGKVREAGGSAGCRGARGRRGRVE